MKSSPTTFNSGKFMSSWFQYILQCDSVPDKKQHRNAAPATVNPRSFAGWRFYISPVKIQLKSSSAEHGFDNVQSLQKNAIRILKIIQIEDLPEDKNRW